MLADLCVENFESGRNLKVKQAEVTEDLVSL
jgi:hypothetical protein